MQEEMVKVPLVSSPFAKHMSESIESGPHGRMAAIEEEAAPSRTAQTDPVGNRKRKTLSVISGHASGPTRYRARTMVVVNYDGDMQKSFELLVRAIGTGRNLLRKAKMEAKMQELSALAGSSESEDEADDNEDDAIMAKVSYRPRVASMRARATIRNSARPGVNGAPSAPVALFDTTDKTLENAQSQCETAAHLTLREGDCRKELGSVRKNLAEVLETAKAQVTNFNAAAPRHPPEPQSQETSNTSVPSIEPAYKKHFPHISAPSPTPPPPPNNTVTTVPVTTLTGLKGMEIEVDDDEEDEEEDFPMPVRYTSRFAAARA